MYGAVGVSLAMASGKSATAPGTNVPSQNTPRRIVLGEEEISDVSHPLDREQISVGYASRRRAMKLVGAYRPLR